ncbi:RadC family protein [Nitratidesulfovibrio vulgaris]|uniref:DNA repair protein RadC n=2 Tax=Nitratidesulfovibrio vulgaris TaxID=881 RepID=Q72CU0_NITV2|nr:DNA repair protein RadC [Nitratidesulfovibrio vulgaris]AAS95671.1 DNA repair protein RadC [Nitratidesulfovibrio vulgaris str. Hildenborough]ABM28881.1 DNA repair protein RadC [Nitratidesulfovibrio vulgaris DP4]ADP86262.1 DNA repair protein RadC [Nitratidesulfovibrio vulgaris RCH1]WCB47755.1 DNA repair protein RadC [Nitratidesulfovibrio vulgaris]
MSDKPHYHGHRERLRERLRVDGTGLRDYELLELLLGTVVLRRDTKPLAKELLHRFGSLRGVLDARTPELLSVKGFGPGLLDYWLLLRECMARYEESPARERKVLCTPQSVAEMARMRLGNCPHEEVWVALLDNQNRLIAWERATKGTVNASVIYPRDVLEMALRCSASGIILVHNHPGGNPVPSQPDFEVTRQLSRSALTLGIRLLDHVIVTDEDCYSLKEDGLL